MKAFWVVFDSTLQPAALASRRRQLSAALRKQSIQLRTIRCAGDTRRAAAKRIAEARGWPVIALDDRHPLTDTTPWLAELTGLTHEFVPARRPQLIYVTRSASADGTRQALGHPLIRHYLKRDGRDRWIEQAAEAAADLAGGHAAVAGRTPARRTAGLPVVGQAPCYRQAVANLHEALASPVSLVTGEAGVGKLYMIRALWQPPPENPRVIVLPCGSFFKDYYVGGVRRRVGGGRDDVDQLRWYFDQAEDGLLVLHHVEKLPSAVQEELAVRLASAPRDDQTPKRLTWVDRENLYESDVTIAATSDHDPGFLRQSGRLIPELADRLCRRHVPVPSLSQRGVEDIRLLCAHLLGRVIGRTPGGAAGRAPKRALTAQAERALSCRAWPGNVSQLIRTLEHAARRSDGRVIRLRDLPPADAMHDGSPTLDQAVRQAQIAAISRALDQTGGNVSQAATLLGRNRAGLHRLMRRLHMTTGRTDRKE